MPAFHKEQLQRKTLHFNHDSAFYKKWWCPSSFTIVTQLESTSGSFENRQLLVVYAIKVTLSSVIHFHWVQTQQRSPLQADPDTVVQKIIKDHLKCLSQWRVRCC
jgi:hypothetical protein